MKGNGVGYAQVHAARDGDPLFQRRTWKRANPGLDHLPDLAEQIKREAVLAKSDPSELAAFKALRLNMGVSDTVENVLIDADVWARIEGDVGASGGYVLGIDLGTTQAMSAAASYHFESGRLDCFAVLPEHPSLAEKGLHDGVGGMYQKMYDRGELHIAGEYVSDVKYLLGTALRKWGRPAVIVADRWREGDLREALSAIQFPQAHFVTRGMGYLDGAADVRRFVQACVSGKCRPVESLMLRAAMSEARVVSDPAGNRKLSKGGEGGRRQRAKDDAVAASILAVAEGERRAATTKPKRSWRRVGLA